VTQLEPKSAFIDELLENENKKNELVQRKNGGCNKRNIFILGSLVKKQVDICWDGDLKKDSRSTLARSCSD
jgi:hypothetical protein